MRGEGGGHPMVQGSYVSVCRAPAIAAMGAKKAGLA
eukprot:CAMPEP_0183398302 /NCGR_PEP_ID=MMETSP0370-20130417/11163_1 /TAXON_ID=268820 /ORGANISM="Peridinium aciculiferum, Strain PAER-2" /LENGTH=35 /DNA_ID= /DNA_START= /DNA_END= /DNA_ORIENTATION=